MKQGGGTARSCGMKREKVEAVLVKNLEPGVWLTAAAIVERIHRLSSTGVPRAFVQNFPPTGRSLSMKLRGSKVVEKRLSNPRDESSALEYRIVWRKT